MKKMNTKFKFLFLSLLLANSTIYAEEDGITLDDSLITIQEKSDEDLVLQFKNLKLERKNFSTQSASGKAGQIIGKFPSVILGGAPGEDKDLIMRGMDKEYTRFELNGFQLPGGGEKREYQMGPLSERMIGEVEIVRNPTPEYEADGIAGRIIAKTRKSKEDNYELNLEGGYRESTDYNFENVGLFINKNITENLSLTANYNYNYNPYLKEKQTDTYKSGVLTTIKEENESKNLKQNNFIGDVNYKYEKGDIKLSTIYLEVEEEKNKETITTTVKTNAKSSSTEIENKKTKTEGFTLNNTHGFNGLTKLESKISYAETSEVKDAIKTSSIETEDKSDKVAEIESKIILLHNFLIPSEFKAGIGFKSRDRYKDKYNNGVLSTGKDSYSLTEDIIYSFAQNEFLITNNLSILGGFRIESSELKSSSTGNDYSTDRNTFVLPGLHILYKLNNNINLKTSVSQSINRPKFDIISPAVTIDGTSKVTLGNPDLDLETSTNLDFSLEYKTKKTLLSATLFHKEVKNVIEEVSTSNYLYNGVTYTTGVTYENSGDGWTRGLELEEKYKLNKNIEIWSNQSFLDSQLTQKNGYERPFKNQPKYTANLGIDLSLNDNKTILSAYGKYIGEIKNLTVTSTKTTTEVEKEKTSLSLKATQKLFKASEIYLEGENLLAPKKEKIKSENGVITETSVESSESIYTLGITVRF